MALPKALEHEYIIGNIFVNILSINKILNHCVRLLMVYIYAENHYNK